jgi:hypothetical protein
MRRVEDSDPGGVRQPGMAAPDGGPVPYQRHCHHRVATAPGRLAAHGARAVTARPRRSRPGRRSHGDQVVRRGDLPCADARRSGARGVRRAGPPATVSGPDEVVASFVETFRGTAEAVARPAMANRLLALSEVIFPTGVPGRARPASVDDRPALIEWQLAFVREALPDHPASDPRPMIDWRAGQQRLRSPVGGGWRGLVPHCGSSPAGPGRGLRP